MKSYAYALFLALAVSIIGPACASLDVVPELSMRTLRISKDIAGFEYRYKDCIKHFLGMCSKSEMKVDYYDLNDPKTKQKLMDMGFVLEVREKPIPQK